MIGSIRKHSQWLWIFVIIVIVLSFVVFFTPEVENIGGGSSENFGTIYGQAIKREDLLQAASEARLTFFFRFQRWPGSDQLTRSMGFDIENEARQRLLMTAQIRKASIKVPDDVVARYIMNIFQDQQTKQFSQASYENFLKNTASQAGVTEQGFETFIRNELALAHLTQIHGLSGKLISTRAAETFYRRENEEVESQVVFLNTSNFVDQVKIETNTIVKYFTNQTARYRIPERAVVSYVYFAYSNTVAEAEKALNTGTNLDTRVAAEYVRRGTNSFKNSDGEVKSAEEAKKSIRKGLVEEKSTELTREKMVAFANEVFRIQPVKAENLGTVAKQHGLPVLESEPFTELDGPKKIDVPNNFASTAFSLTLEEPLASPLSWIDGVYLIAYNRRVPPEVPGLTSVWDKVVADYKRSQSQELTVNAGMEIAQSITNGLALGKSFSDLCATNKLAPVKLPPITRVTRSIPAIEDEGISPTEYRELVFSLKTGYASGFRQSGFGGYIAFASGAKPVTPERLQAEMPKFLNDLRANRVNYAFQDWFRGEIGKAGIGTPAQAGGQ